MKTKTKASPSRRSATEAAAGLLCGTDFTENARAAAEVAALLAQHWNVSLTLAHASPVPAWPSARKALGKEAARIRSLAPITVESEMLDGDPDEALVARAEKPSTRMVVVSSLGRRSPSRWFLGSVSERTAERAPIPTLVVRSAAPFNAWIRGERPLKVLVAFNFTVTSDSALRWVNELRRIGPCDLVVAHVDWPPEQASRLGVTGHMRLVGNPPEVQTVLVRDLKARATELLGTTEFRARVEANWGRPDIRLADIASEEQADLVVVGSHQYSGFERLWQTSVSRGLLHRATTNVVVVPTRTEQRHGDNAIPWVWRVLVSTDFSELGDHAIPHAYAALPQGGVVKLVHVVDPYALPNGEYVQGFKTAKLEAQHRKLVEAGLRKLRALIPPEADERGISTEIEVIEHGNPAAAIAKEAERFGADLVCLGTHGRSGLSKTLFGSTAQAVLASLRRPVLLIKPPAV